MYRSQLAPQHARGVEAGLRHERAVELHGCEAGTREQPNHGATSSDPDVRIDRRSVRSHRVNVCVALAGGVVLLGAGQRATDDVGRSSVPANGIFYDIHLTTVTTPAPDSTTGVAEPPTTTTALAHAQAANGKARIDIADGYFAGIWLSPGDYLIVSDSGRTVVVVNPPNQLYANVDMAQLGKTGVSFANAFGTILGAKGSNVKVAAIALPPEKIGQYTAQRYRVTEEYTVVIPIEGMPPATTTHDTTDLWYVPSLTAIVNPFPLPIARGTPTTTFIGQDYTTQMTAAKAKLPAGLPIKSIAVSSAVDAKGSRSGSSTTWEIDHIAQGNVSDSTFVVPAGYTQFTGNLVMMPTRGKASGISFTGAGSTGTTSAPSWTGSGSTGTSGTSAPSWAGGASTGTTGTGTPSRGGAADTMTDQAASDAAARAAAKILHPPNGSD